MTKGFIYALQIINVNQCHVTFPLIEQHINTNFMEENNPFESRLDLQPLKNSIDAIKMSLGNWVVGQHEFIQLLVVGLLANGHVLIEGVPGIAKTMTAKLLAKSIDTKFARIQFTPDLMPSDVLGTSVYNFQNAVFEFKAGPIFANMVLIDEINRSPAKTQAALFEVMEERQITIDGNTYPMQQPFMVLATQNPIEQEGTYRLPEAQLDRFLFKISVNYPNLQDEIAILQKFNISKPLLNVANAIQAVLSPSQIMHYKQLIAQVVVQDNILEYIAKIVYNSRQHKDLYLGASPRASLALLNSAKALAASQARDFVTPEDIQYLSKPVMRHRVILNPEAEMEGKTTDQIIEQLVSTIEVPR